jgi:hypothetical protein
MGLLYKTRRAHYEATILRRFPVVKELEEDLLESRPSRNKSFRGKVAEAVRRATLADLDSNVFTLTESPNRR